MQQAEFAIGSVLPYYRFLDFHDRAGFCPKPSLDKVRPWHKRTGMTLVTNSDGTSSRMTKPCKNLCYR